MVYLTARIQKKIPTFAKKETQHNFSSSNGKKESVPNIEDPMNKTDKCVGGKDRLLNYSKNAKESDLLRCIRYGFTSEALSLIEAGANIETQNGIGDTPLNYAVLTNNIEVFKILLEKGANPKVKYRYEPVIAQAVMVGNYEMVELLLSSGVDPNSTFHEGTSILYLAAVKGDLKIASLLLDSGADIHFDSQGEVSGGPPFIGAVMGENLNMIQFLLEKGANINQPEWYHNRTVLWDTVCFEPNIELARFLLKKGANPNIRDAGGFSGNPNDGRTPLMCAVKDGNVEMVKLLVSNGADVHEVNLINKTAIEKWYYLLGKVTNGSIRPQ